MEVVNFSNLFMNQKVQKKKLLQRLINIFNEINFAIPIN